MPEILTESFCERCGTRYTFESAAPAGKRLGKFKVLSKGLKNFVLDDESSLDEALAAARGEKDREATSEQLDAFHKTFNFCMTCRQYTCANCWNDAEGRCLTCAPQLNGGGLAAASPALDFNPAASSVPEDWPKLDQLAWPTTDLPVREPEPAPVWMIETQTTDSAETPAATPDPDGAAQAAAGAEVAPDPAAAMPEGTWPSEPEPLPVSDPSLERELAAYFSDPEPVLLDAADGRMQADPVRDDSIAAVEATPERAAASSATDSTLDDGRREGADLTQAGVPDLADLRAAMVVDEPSEIGEAGESYEVAEATDPHILARLASIATPADIRRPARGKAKVTAGDDTAALIGDTAAPGDVIPPVADHVVDEPPLPEQPAARPTSPLLRKLRPGQSLDAALEAFEAALGDRAPGAAEAAAASGESADAAPAAGDLADTAPERDEDGANPEIAAAATEPAADGPSVEPDLAHAPDIAWPAADSGRRPNDGPPRRAPSPRSRPADDRVEVPTWRITPDAAPHGIPESLPHPAAAAPDAAKPEWPGQPATDSLAFLAGRGTRTTPDGIWAASTRDLLAPVNGPVAPASIQSCVSCGLSLSATARFCRRCGTRQAG